MCVQELRFFEASFGRELARGLLSIAALSKTTLDMRVTACLIKLTRGCSCFVCAASLLVFPFFTYTAGSSRGTHAYFLLLLPFLPFRPKKEGRASEFSRHSHAPVLAGARHSPLAPRRCCCRSRRTLALLVGGLGPPAASEIRLQFCLVDVELLAELRDRRLLHAAGSERQPQASFKMFDHAQVLVAAVEGALSAHGCLRG